MCGGRSDDGAAIQWDTATNQCVRLFQGHEGAVQGICCSPNGEDVFTASVTSSRSYQLLALTFTLAQADHKVMMWKAYASTDLALDAPLESVTSSATP